MAPFRVAVHFFCFVLLLAFSAPRAQARESQFFSKAERYTAPKEASTPAAKEELPAAKQDEEVQYKPDNGGGGYGLYGHGPDKVPAATTASSSGAFPTYTYNTGAGETHFNTESFPSEFNNEEFDGAARYGNKEFNTGAAAGYRSDNNNYAGDSTLTNYYAASGSSIPQNEPNGAARYGNNKDFNTGAAAGYRPDNKNYAGDMSTPTNYYAASDSSSIPQNEPNGAYKYYNKESNTRYPRYANQQAGEQYGLSDTRFLDNGKYFYDLKAEDSYRNGRYVDPARGNLGGAHGSFGGGQTFANGAGYPYGNNNNSNNNNNNNNNNGGVGNGYEPENNSMQGYQNNSMQGYQNNQQEEYVP